MFMMKFNNSLYNKCIFDKKGRDILNLLFREDYQKSLIKKVVNEPFSEIHLATYSFIIIRKLMPVR